MTLGEGTPAAPGLYACKIYFGWKLLEWTGKYWSIGEGIAPWAMDIYGWAGPLPDWQGVLAEREKAKPVIEYDL